MKFFKILFIRFFYDKLVTTLEDSLLSTDGDARILSGSIIPNNYVSYSGYLWRVTALNDDGSIKLVTNNTVSSKDVSSNFKTSTT